jgi:phage terminase small subunit
MAKKSAKPVDYSKPLKNRQYEAFCQFSYSGVNATKSAIKAKYSKKSARTKGSQLLTIEDIQKRIAFLQNKVAEKAEITIANVVEDIRDTHRRAKLDGDEYPAELKASDMLMKHLGGYEKDNEQQQIVIHKPLTEQQLKDRLAEVEAAGNGIDVSSIG